MQLVFSHLRVRKIFYCPNDIASRQSGQTDGQTHCCKMVSTLMEAGLRSGSTPCRCCSTTCCTTLSISCQYLAYRGSSTTGERGVRGSISWHTGGHQLYRARKIKLGGIQACRGSSTVQGKENKARGHTGVINCTGRGK